MRRCKCVLCGKTATVEEEHPLDMYFGISCSNCGNYYISEDATKEIMYEEDARKNIDLVIQYTKKYNKTINKKDLLLCNNNFNRKDDSFNDVSIYCIIQKYVK